MIDVRTRVIQVTFESEPDLKHPWKRQTRITAVILYPLEVKRQLATVDTAKARAVKLARQLIERDCFRPPILEALNCSVDVTLYDLRPAPQTALDVRRRNQSLAGRSRTRPRLPIPAGAVGIR